VDAELGEVMQSMVDRLRGTNQRNLTGSSSPEDIDSKLTNALDQQLNTDMSRLSKPRFKEDR